MQCRHAVEPLVVLAVMLVVDVELVDDEEEGDVVGSLVGAGGAGVLFAAAAAAAVVVGLAVLAVVGVGWLG